MTSLRVLSAAGLVFIIAAYAVYVMSWVAFFFVDAAVQESAAAMSANLFVVAIGLLIVSEKP